MNLLFSISISLSLDLGNKRLGFCVSAFFRRVCVCVRDPMAMDEFFFRFQQQKYEWIRPRATRMPIDTLCSDEAK